MQFTIIYPTFIRSNRKSLFEARLKMIGNSSLLQQQRLRVCEVCSSYLENFDGVHDNDKRLADHYGGKLHLGFIDLRCGL